MLPQLCLVTLASAVVQCDFHVENSGPNSHNAHHSLHRRTLSSNSSADNSTVEPIINATLTTGYNFYHGSINVGSPPQKLDVLLDTGSPITWVYGPQGSYNNATKFYSNQSSTFKNGNHSFSAAYGSGQYLGHWGNDIVSTPQFIQSSVLQNSNSTQNITSIPFDFGIISSFSTSAGAPGLLGLGPHIAGAGPSTYKSLPEAYFKHNVTSSPAFSVFLEGSEGRFLFGGVDTKFFEFPLYRFHPKSSLSGSPSNGGPPGAQQTSWNIFLDGATLNHGAHYIVRSSVTLDTGSPVSLLPPGFVDAVGKSLGLTKYGKYETYYVNSTVNPTLPNGTITFEFNGINIDADISNFLVPGEYIWLDDGPKNVTALALMGSPNYLLGDAFFRSAYTVLDPASHDVFLGKRTTAMINSSHTTNSSTIVPLMGLIRNSSAIVNASSLPPIRESNGSKGITTSPIGAVSTTRVVVAANQYLGTVPADKAASLTSKSSEATDASSAAESTASSTASATSSTSSSSSSSPSSKSKSNAGLMEKPSTKLCVGLMMILAII